MVYQPIVEGGITHKYKEILKDLTQLAIEAKSHNRFLPAVGETSFDADVYVANRSRLVAVYRKNDKVVVASANILVPFNSNRYTINHIHYYELPVEKETVIERFNLVINEYLIR